MKTYLECIPCFFNQALFAARTATRDEATIKRVLDGVARLIPGIPMDQPPPETARGVYAEIRKATGESDPFKAYKEKSIQRTLALFGKMKSEVERAEDPLRAAVRIAIAGNVIDLGANPDFDLEAELKEVQRKDLGIDDYASFQQALEESRGILYLGDNAGETVFDRLLIEVMGREEVFEAADMIVSKGQGNFETLSDVDAPIFYLLKTKCSVIARHLGTKNGDMVLKDARKGM